MSTAANVTGAEGWTPDAIALVDRAIAAHGGRPAWQAAQRIRLPFHDASGPLLALKGYGRTFPAPRAYEVLPHERTTIFHGYPDDHSRGLFVDGDVRIERVDGGKTTLESRNHRRTMTGVAKYRRWSPLDALYFFGYAICHYHVLPFTLTEARFVGIIRRRGMAEGLDVIFPPHVHTHCRRQQVYFGADGRIVRHDYVADVIGAWARGAHYWEDYGRCDGLLVARRRRVVARIGRWPTPIPVVCITLGEPTLACV